MAEIRTTPNTQKILASKDIYTTEDLLNCLPKKYYDYIFTYREIYPSMVGFTGCFCGVGKKIKKINTSTKCSCITFKIEMKNGKSVRVTLFGHNYIYKSLQNKIGKNVAAFGRLEYDEKYGYSLADVKRIVYEQEKQPFNRIEPEYTHIPKISQETLVKLIDEALDQYEEKPLDLDLAKKYHLNTLPSTKDAYQMLHHPTSLHMEKAIQRLVVNDMLKFAVNMERQSRNKAKGTHVVIRTTKVTQDIIASLPYTLTQDQKTSFEKMKADIRNGKRVSALIQGDVGCGKTMIATLMLFLMAENGYQGVLMAPTSILAKQHYEEIKKYGDRYGIHVVYLDGKMSASAKKNVLSDITSGSAQIVIGTHTLSGNITYSNSLGMVIIDEEHRFGVDQRNALLDKAEKGVNTIVMSATPIPRTVAGILHGNDTEIYDIHTMPACRKPVQTAINCSDTVIFNFLEKQLAQGRQVYVVCPLIETNTDTELMKDVLSVEETYQIYQKHFQGRYHVAMLNGKMKEAETNSIIQDFKDNRTQILISTTVIEVGVNVPNASVIVISNAERFGLAAMHQLRGRVGRGSYNSYCILKSTDKANQRLNTMVRCADGFHIAEEDLRQRGAGDLIGTKQSGFFKYMDLIIKYPNLYSIIKKLAVEVVDRM